MRPILYRRTALFTTIAEDLSKHVFLCATNINIGLFA